MAEPVKAPAPVPPDTVDMVDHDGAVHAIPAAQAGEAYRSGQYGLRDDQTVYVRRGKDVVPVTGAQAGELFRGYADIGGGVSSEAGFQKSEERKRFEGLGHEVAAPLVGAADALTLGLLPALLPQGGTDYLRAQKEHNPGLTTAGEVGGLILPALVSGGGSVAAKAGVAGARGLAAAEEGGALARGLGLGLRGVTAPLRGVSALGRGVETGVGKLGALAGDSALARGATHVAGRGLAGAVETGVFGAGQAVGDAAIKGEPLTVDKIAGGVGLSALVGGALGAGLAVGGIGAREGLAAAGRGVKAAGAKGLDLALRGAKGLAGITRRAAEAGEREAAIGDEIVEGAQRAEAARAEGALHPEEAAGGGPAIDPHAPPGETTAVGGVARKAISDEDAMYEVARTITGYGENAEARGLTKRDAVWKDAARENTFRSFGGSQKQMAELNRAGREVQEALFAQAHGDIPKLAGKKSFGSVNRTEMADAWAKKAAAEGERVDALRVGLDKLETGIKLDDYKIAADIDKKIIAPMRELGEIAAPDVAAVNEVTDAVLNSLHGKGFADAARVRRYIDNKVNFARDSKQFSVEAALKGIRTIVEDHIEQTGEAAAQSVGGAFRAQYSQAKIAFRAAKLGEEMTATGALRDQANAGMSLREQIGQIGGGGAGALAGSFLGPVGTVLGGAVGGVAVGAYKHVERLYGSQLLADVAHRAATTDVLTAITQTVDSRIGKGLAEFFRETAGKAKGASRAASAAVPSASRVAAEGLRVTGRSAEAKQREFEAKRAELATFAAGGLAAATRAVAGVAEHHPELAAKLAEKTLSTTQFLMDRLPPEMAMHHQLTPQLSTSRAPQPLVDKWLAYLRYTDNPALVLEELGKGQASREGAEVLRECYPAMFKQAQDQIAQKLTELKKPLEYQKEQQLAILYDVPTRPCMTADFVQSQQAAYAGGGGPPGASGGAPHAPGGTLHLADSYQTGTQKTGSHL